VIEAMLDLAIAGAQKTWATYQYLSKTHEAWTNLDGEMPKVTRSFQKVRQELCEIGLLAKGVWLDQIELYVAVLPSMGEAGYVFDDSVPWWGRSVGFEPGMIYLPSDLPFAAYVPGGTMADVIRHEFAHSWRWLDPCFFEEDWFVRAFGSTYLDHEYCGKEVWEERFFGRRVNIDALERCKSTESRVRLISQGFDQEFVSHYGSTSTCEDFAETFRHFLRYRNSLDRFKPRKGLYKKLKAVERAVHVTQRNIGL